MSLGRSVLKVENTADVLEAFNSTRVKCGICAICIDNILKYGGFKNYYVIYKRQYGPRSMRWHLENCLGVLVEGEKEKRSG